MRAKYVASFLMVSLCSVLISALAEDRAEPQILYPENSPLLIQNVFSSLAHTLVKGVLIDNGYEYEAISYMVDLVKSGSCTNNVIRVDRPISVDYRWEKRASYSSDGQTSILNAICQIAITFNMLWGIREDGTLIVWTDADKAIQLYGRVYSAEYHADNQWRVFVVENGQSRR